MLTFCLILPHSVSRTMQTQSTRTTATENNNFDMELLEWNVQHAMSNKKYAMFSERWAVRLVHEHANATSNVQGMLSLFYAEPTYTLFIIVYHTKPKLANQLSWAINETRSMQMLCCIQFASYSGKEHCKDGWDQEHANTPHKCTQPPKHLVCKCILSKTTMDVMD